MTDATKPTPGPVEIQNCTDVFTRLGAFNASGEKAPDNDGWHIADCATGFIPLAETRANAALIAEAFNVHTETGRTPRQLAEQRDELLKALKELSHWFPPDSALDSAGYTADETNAASDSYEAANAIIAKVEAKP